MMNEEFAHSVSEQKAAVFLSLQVMQMVIDPKGIKRQLRQRYVLEQETCLEGLRPGFLARDLPKVGSFVHIDLDQGGT